jgi:predicted GNAT family N-acyltransferase
VVEGQRLLQCVSDPFLGWTTTPGGHQVYWRQLRDWKASLPVEAMKPDALKAYGRLCASVLARGHARSGDRLALAVALEGQTWIDRSLAVDALAYADQVERDHGRLLEAMACGRLAS